LGDYFWINSGGNEEIVLHYKRTGNWYLLDPLTETIQPMLSAPELYNPLVPDSAGVTFTRHPDGGSNAFYSWTITYPNGQQIDGQNRVSDAARVTLAPDGQTLVQVTTDGLLSFLSPDGQVMEGPDLEDNFATLFWGQQPGALISLPPVAARAHHVWSSAALGFSAPIPRPTIYAVNPQAARLSDSFSPAKTSVSWPVQNV
jgi:hypothetical protein